jgi:hypothetical protein
MTPYIKLLNDRVKLLNLNRSTNLTLTATEARMLHTEVFALLEKISSLQNQLLIQQPQVQDAGVSGGSW